MRAARRLSALAPATAELLVAGAKLAAVTLMPAPAWWPLALRFSVAAPFRLGVHPPARAMMAQQATAAALRVAAWSVSRYG